MSKDNPAASPLDRPLEHVPDATERRGPELGLDRRGGLNLAHDRSGHRRYATLYDDLLT